MTCHHNSSWDIKMYSALKNGTCSVTVLVAGVGAINGVLTDTAAAAWNAAPLSSTHLHLTWNYGLLGLLKPVRGFSLHTSIRPLSVAQTTTPLWSSHLYLSSSAAQTAVLLWMYDGHLLISFGGQTHGNHMTKGLGYDILYNHFVCVCVCVCVCAHACVIVMGLCLSGCTHVSWLWSIRGLIQKFPDWCRHLHSSCVSAKQR